jgi:hypothetical protein
MKLDVSRQIFEKYSDIKFDDSPSIGSSMRTDVRSDTTKPVVAFRECSIRVPGSFTYPASLRAVKSMI